MARLTRNLFPVVERRRRPTHREFQGDRPTTARPVSADRALAVVASVLCLLVIAFVPAISTALPRAFGY